LFTLDVICIVAILGDINNISTQCMQYMLGLLSKTSTLVLKLELSNSYSSTWTVHLCCWV